VGSVEEDRRLSLPQRPDGALGARFEGGEMIKQFPVTSIALCLSASVVLVERRFVTSRADSPAGRRQCP
jgi:hypothetical protein